MLRFGFLGFPIGVRWPFWLVASLLTFGVTAASPGVGGLILWACSVLVVLASILFHEFGHALWQRRLGARRVEISVDGLGGVSAAYGLPALTKGQAIMISAAGPAFSIGLGLALSWINGNGWLGHGQFGAVLIGVAIFVNLVWGVLNLAPIYPLDGGQIFSVIVGGNPRVVGWTGAVVGGAIGVWMLVGGIFFGGILFCILAYENYRRAAGIPGQSFLTGR
jgi:stage IV sporulation protein FB